MKLFIHTSFATMKTHILIRSGDGKEVLLKAVHCDDLSPCNGFYIDDSQQNELADWFCSLKKNATASSVAQ